MLISSALVHVVSRPAANRHPRAVAGYVVGETGFAQRRRPRGWRDGLRAMSPASWLERRASCTVACIVVGGTGGAVEELSLKLNSWTDRQVNKKKQRELEPHVTLYCQSN